MNPPEGIRVEVRLQFFNCPIVQVAFDMSCHYRNQPIFDRGVYDVSGIYDQVARAAPNKKFCPLQVGSLSDEGVFEFRFSCMFRLNEFRRALN